MKKESIRNFFEKVGYALSCALFAGLLIVAIAVLVQTIQNETTSFARAQYALYLGIGFASFFSLFLFPRTRNNVRWMMSFSHEFTHLLFALLFFRKIHRLKVDDQDCHIFFSNRGPGYLTITLSPYCVPIFTLALLPWHFTTDATLYLHVIQILLGFSFAFHVSCWIKQTRLHQTDLTGPGIVRSILVVSSIQILFLCLTLMTPSSGVENAFERVFWKFPVNFIDAAATFFRSI
jgi:hypothetical protein